MSPYRRYKFPWRHGNRFETLVDSTAFFPRMLDTIALAGHYILLEMYLAESGSVMDRFIEALLAAAARGVRVYLLFDDFGSQQLTPRDRARLVHPGVEVVYYNPLHSYSRLYNLYRILWLRTTHGLFRDHRKLLLVDGECAFTGGAGLTDEIEPPHAPGLQWRETMIEIRGPVTGDWQRLFTENWNLHAEQPLALPAGRAATVTADQQGRVTVNEARSRMGIQRSLLGQIKRARYRVWFATAYFIPPWTLRRQLKRAAKRGVDVRLLLPGPITDHPGIRYASRRYYGRLLKSDVRIFEYKPRFFHAKTVVCDDWITIGSCNFDRWNLQWNLEANQEINSPDLAKTFADIFEADFASSVEQTHETWEQRGWRLRLLEWFWRKMERLSIKIRHRRRR
jgi:phosphatidylserine/phosphatidylglycerophosphate/cardiolipin synthase-like enzyme